MHTSTNLPLTPTTQKYQTTAPSNEQDDSLIEQLTHTPKLCGQCESSRTALLDVAPQPPTTQMDRTPPYPDDTYPDRPFPEDTYITIGAYSPLSSLRRTYVAKYLDIPWTYAAIGSERGNSHPDGPPLIVDDDSDESNDDINPTNNQRPASYKPETTRATYQEISQPTGDTQKTAHTEQEIPTTIFQTTPPRRPRLGFAISNKGQAKRTTSLWTYSKDTPQQYETKPPRHRRTSVPALTTKETDETAHGPIGTEDMIEQEITGQVPDRGKESKYGTQRVKLI